jgi:cysteine desulfurase / selenocysteine lyase
MKAAVETFHPPTSSEGYDVDRIREQFPILNRRVNGKPLIYLDNAATTQKPHAVIDAIRRYYSEHNSNIHRGVHYLSQKATEEYEGVRKKLKDFINADHTHEIIYVRGATEAINLVAHSFCRNRIRANDEILISGMEHHSNIVPWQILCEETGAQLKVVPISDAGEIDRDEYGRLLGPKVKMVSLVHISNSLGTINDVKEMIAMAHARGIPILIDGAQAVSHMKVDVRDLDCDFYVFSGHKMFGPTGVGVLYGKTEHLEKMPPYQGGGDMIKSVTFEKTIYNELPYKFEAGTPNIAGVIGLGPAIDFIASIGLEHIARYEQELLRYATDAVSGVDGLRIIGTAAHKSAVISFMLEDVHPHDIGTIIDAEGVAIRTGHHCTQPVMQRFGIPATARASFAMYNTRKEVDALVKGIHKVKKVFR